MVERIRRWPHGLVGTRTQYEKSKEEFYRLHVGPRLEKAVSNNEAYKCHFCNTYQDGRAPYRVHEEHSSAWEYVGMCDACHERINNIVWEAGVGYVRESESDGKWLAFFFIIGLALGTLLAGIVLSL